MNFSSTISPPLLRRFAGWLFALLCTFVLAACGGGDSDDGASTGVLTAPSITTQPASASVTEGATATFSVVAAGSDPLTYQWQKSGTAIAGATASSYTAPATTIADTGAVYTVVVANPAGSVTSAAATLTVGSTVVAPSVVTQPAAQTVAAPAPATFTATFSGTEPISYQWTRNGAAIAGATGTSYTTPATTVATDNGAVFAVVATNAGGSAPTNNAVLTVNPAPTPISITTQPSPTSGSATARPSMVRPRRPTRPQRPRPATAARRSTSSSAMRSTP